MTNQNNISKLCLGTVQFGMDYGISNHKGKTPKKEVMQIMELAHSVGIRYLDTASQYGNSEKIIGETVPVGHEFKIITKTPHLKTDKVDQEHVNILLETFEQSLNKLKVSKVYGLLFHNVEDLLVQDGEKLYYAIHELKAAGKVENVGISVYNAGQIDAVISRYEIDIIQVPVSILDQRLIQSGHLKALNELGVEIHARSIFLQGLLLMNPNKLSAQFDSAYKLLNKLYMVCTQCGTTPLSACIRFVLELPEIKQLVVGVTSKKELVDIFEAAKNGTGLQDYSCFSCNNDAILNPVQWKH